MTAAMFTQASEDCKKANPHIFGVADSSTVEQPLYKGQVAGSSPAPPTKYEAKLEKELQEQITGFLERNDTVVIRSRTDKKTSTNVGTPDLLFAVKGRAIAFEVKMPGKKPTKAQVEMIAKMIANGWNVFVVDDYDEAVEIFQKISA